MTLNLEQLRQKARELALTDDSRVSRRPSKAFLRQFRQDAEKIQQFIHSLQDECTLCTQPAEEWLLDHAGLILEQYLVVHEQLDRKMLKRLPQLRSSGIPRLLPICKEYFVQTDGELNEETFLAYIQDYQEVSVLTTAEVWAVPIFLRMALLGRLAEIMEHVRERREVCLFVERLLQQIKPYKSDPQALNEALENAGKEMPFSGALIVHLVSHLREWEDDSAAVREWLKCKLENGAESLDQIQTYEFQLQAAYQVQTGNLIGSLRKIERWNWLETMEKMSRVEQILRGEKSGIYPRLDETSRDVLRKRVEILSHRFHVPESTVAEQAVELAADEYDRNCRASDGVEPMVQDRAGEFEVLDKLPRTVFAAYYLLEPEGIKRLRRALALCCKVRRTSRMRAEIRSARAYFSLLLGSFFVVLLGFAWWIGNGIDGTPLEWLLIFSGVVFPASEWAVTLAHGWIVYRKKPLPLLRYDFSQGIPDEAGTMVVIPVIWSTPEEVHEMAERLELHYLANRDKNIRFALLGDFADAKAQNLPEDASVVEAARQRILSLNDKYGGGTFYLFQRRRLWNPSEGVWMGWERKRGKLVELVELLRGNKDTTFDVMIGDPEVFQKIRYIITLDADTLLPVGSAQRMIAAMHLPYNRPRLNKRGTRVVEGYGVLQPRIGIHFKGVGHSRLAALWGEASGIDPYAFAVSDPYQDGVGEGIFYGKGIFDVDVFKQVLCDRIPDNRVLSHDLLEGGFLRAGFISDIELLDDQPATFSAFQKRMHRWVRGDWQLICWLLPRFCDRKGMFVPVDLSSITRWQIVDNLRRSLMPPALFALFCLGLTVLPGSAGKWLVTVLATLFLPFIRQSLNIRKLWANPQSLGTTAGQALLLLAALPFQSVLMLDAIGRTLYRLWITKRHLLEWVSSGEVERRYRGGRPPVLLGIKGGYALILLGALAAWAQPLPGPRWAGLAVVAVWALAPAWIAWLNQPPKSPEETLDATEREELRKLAEQIWGFFENYVTEKDHWLPPDNVQMDPPIGTAHRTSPTNIGLYLASALAARDFGFIDTPGLIRRLERTIDTVERLEKWHGHLYNWYNTLTLEILPPKYVSSVDSGNFICCLVTVKEGLAEWLEHDYGQRAGENSGREWLERGKQLIGRIETLVEKTDFAPLFDSKTKLFSLGYNESKNRLDSALYDLLASESRQTSFIAIALGHIPVTHWKTLGRTMTKIGRRPTLLSWSGTMFEYLMPCLFMRTYPKTLWSSTYQAVVKRQMEYAHHRGVPFGISESAYYAFDYQMNYQYRAFGVPSLGFQRGLERDLVISPYASILAIPFAKRKVLENLRRLEKLGARGEYGFFEAVDFTAERMPKDKRYAVIRSFMAHHQGMSLLALANTLLDQKMTERFHRDKRVQSVELLLQERIPERPKILRNYDWLRSFKGGQDPLKDTGVPLREYVPAHGWAPVPEVAVLSNGYLTTLVTDSGGGFISFGEKAVTRWRSDPVQDDWGNFFYIRDVSRDKVWSPSFHPCRDLSSDLRVQFSLDRATFLHEGDDLQTSLEICVSPEWNADVRKLTLTNTGTETRVLEVTTYYEIVLADPNMDNAHPAFSKLFIETEYEKESGCLLALRRPRNEREKPVWAAHALIPAGPALGSAEVETDRSEFIGRGNTRSHPKGLRSRLRGTVGAVTDPVFVMRRRLAIEPGEQRHLFAVTCVGDSKQEVLDIASRFSENTTVERTFHLAWTRSQIELRHLHLTPQEAADFHQLAGRLLYRAPMGDAQKRHIALNKKGQPGLWAYGISGDRPILLVRIDNRGHMRFVSKILRGYEYLRRLGIRFDLVLLNESEGGYQQHLQDALRRAVEEGVHQGPGEGGVFILNKSTMPKEDQTLLLSIARLVLRADGRSLKAQIRLRAFRAPLPEPAVPQTGMDGINPSFAENVSDLKFFNGWGGFSQDGREYRILLKNSQPPPAPWINVLSNPRLGCLVSERGTGYTWWSNSREFKLTPWSNDPVLDPPSEAGYIRDEESGEYWTLFPSGAPLNQVYEVTHGLGFTRFRHARNGILHEAAVFVPPEDPVKIVEIRVKNQSQSARRLTFTYYVEWVLGVLRETNAPFIITEWDENTNSLQAYNTYQEHFKGATAFLGIYPEAKPPEGVTGEVSVSYAWTADRLEFVGRNGNFEHPAAMKRGRLSGKTGPCDNPCGALQIQFFLESGAEKVFYVVLGCEESRTASLRLAEKYRDGQVFRGALEHTKQFWEQAVRQIEVSTPCAEMDLLLNGWLLYQALACRMWARTGFYQAGGAYGYRDQLQDSLAFLHTRPELAKAQILLHAAHQYEEGDVQHWWHEETGFGIRTRFSDDYLWLPYAVSRYMEHTEDRSILEEEVSFLTSEPLGPEEHERYEPTRISQEKGTVYEHCLRAIELALMRTGEHGLPLIGIGDWNDGMSSVGDEGRGESVWLAWFLCDILERFADICQRQGDGKRAERYRQSRERISSAVEEHGWDGQWYRRAFTDSGQWLGSIRSQECRIDAIAQSWSVLSGAAPLEKARQAMQSFDNELVDRNLSVARLLTPPFDRTVPSPGYIQGYPPGIRENGGQYTHGAIWSVIAWCLLGRGDKAVELFQILNPLEHTKTPGEVRRYKGEPYVMAADVYTASPHEGRAGWTWYTGAAGWMYQAGIEWILGLRRKGHRLYIRPCIPDSWPGFTVRYRFGKTCYVIHVKKKGLSGGAEPNTGSEQRSELVKMDRDNAPYIELFDDGQHHELNITIR